MRKRMVRAAEKVQGLVEDSHRIAGLTDSAIGLRSCNSRAKLRWMALTVGAAWPTEIGRERPRGSIDSLDLCGFLAKKSMMRRLGSGQTRVLPGTVRWNF